MNKWEDILKDKLEGYESTLPEGSLAAFHARRGAIQSTTAVKSFPVFWMMVAAAAAGLAAILFLRKPDVPEDAIRFVEQPAPAVAVATDSTDVSEPAQTSALVAFVNTPRATVKRTVPVQIEPVVIMEEESEVQSQPEIESEDSEQKPTDTIVDDSDNQAAIDTPPSVNSPYIPEAPVSKPVGMRVGPAAGIIAGSGVLVGLGSIAPLLVTRDYTIEGDHVSRPNGRYYIPFRTGISARFPLYERLNITTGLEYSLYASRIYNKTKLQLAHYMGIPVRLDWTVAFNSRFDVYIGAGVEGSYCIAATQNGVGIPKDGFGLSILGAGGIQWNISKSFGLYIEPVISWTAPLSENQLYTYRNQFPVELSITSGLRFTFSK